MQEDRHVEFHTQGSRYYRLRIPSYGRDMALHGASAELYFVGARYNWIYVMLCLYSVVVTDVLIFIISTTCVLFLKKRDFKLLYI